MTDHRMAFVSPDPDRGMFHPRHLFGKKGLQIWMNGHTASGKKQGLNVNTKPTRFP